jgi:hypothetical protein
MVSFKATPKLAITTNSDDVANNAQAHPGVVIALNGDQLGDVEVRIEAGATVAKGKNDVDISNKSAVLILEKGDNFKVEAGLLDNALSLTLNTSANINDKNVALEYKANPGENTSSIKGSFDVNDDIGASIEYDLSGFNAFDTNKITVGATYKVNDDTSAETKINLGNKRNETKVTYRLDDSNTLTATAHLNLEGGDVLDRLVLKLKNSSDVLGKGSLTAEATVQPSGSVAVKATKEWDLDL